MKLKRSTKGFLIVFVPFFFGYLLGLATAGCTSDRERSKEPKSITYNNKEDIIDDDIADEAVEPKKDEEEKPKVEQKEIIYYRNRLKYASIFRDLNEEHLAMARKVGLSQPPKSRAEIANNKRLVELHNNDLYTIYNLRYSSPYLTRGAAKELHAIAQAFSDSLKSKNLLDYRLVVTSVLRSEDDVKNLRRSGNPNASDNSAHCYGTTFDITYTRYDRDNDDTCPEFMQPFELTKVLGEVLLDRKKAGKCLIKYEKKEHCFHITATY